MIGCDEEKYRNKLLNYEVTVIDKRAAGMCQNSIIGVYGKSRGTIGMSFVIYRRKGYDWHFVMEQKEFDLKYEKI